MTDFEKQTLALLRDIKRILEERLPPGEMAALAPRPRPPAGAKTVEVRRNDRVMAR